MRAVDVGSEAREHAALPEPPAERFGLQRPAQLSRADNDEARGGHGPQHAGHGREQGRVVLVLGEGGHAADHGAARRDTELPESLAPASLRRPVDDAVMDEEQAAGRQAVVEQAPGDGPAHGDHAVAGGVLAAGEGAPHGERHAAARDHARPRAEPCSQQAGAGRVRVVRVDHVRGFPAKDPGESEDRGRSEVSAEGDRAHGEPGGSCPCLEPPSGLASHGDRVATGRHAPRRQEHLALAPSPLTSRVDVDDTHASKMHRGPAWSLQRRVKSPSGM